MEIGFAVRDSREAGVVRPAVVVVVARAETEFREEEVAGLEQPTALIMRRLRPVQGMQPAAVPPDLDRAPTRLYEPGGQPSPQTHPVVVVAPRAVRSESRPRSPWLALSDNSMLKSKWENGLERTSFERSP